MLWTTISQECEYIFLFFLGAIRDNEVFEQPSLIPVLFVCWANALPFELHPWLRPTLADGQLVQRPKCRYGKIHARLVRFFSKAKWSPYMDIYGDCLALKSQSNLCGILSSRKDPHPLNERSLSCDGLSLVSHANYMGVRAISLFRLSWVINCDEPQYYWFGAGVVRTAFVCNYQLSYRFAGKIRIWYSCVKYTWKLVIEPG